jgi:AbrB family looped-hinge helix DNA binding protein
MKATVAERGQVTIPKPLREKLVIKPGAILEFEVEDGRLIARKRVDDPISAVIGCLPQGDVDAVIAELRGTP